MNSTENLKIAPRSPGLRGTEVMRTRARWYLSRELCKRAPELGPFAEPMQRYLRALHGHDNIENRELPNCSDAFGCFSAAIIDDMPAAGYPCRLGDMHHDPESLGV